LVFHREGYELWMFQKIFDPQIEEIPGGWGEFHGEELHNL
jgi:hypothetical protein